MPDFNNSTNCDEKRKFFLVAPDLSFAAANVSMDGARTFKGVAYSGEVVTDHFWWNAVIFDLEGISFSHGRMPVLKDHDPSLILGYTTAFSKSGRLEVEGTFLASSQEAAKVIEMADENYPWQLSVHIAPDHVQILQRGDKDMVNGKEVAGPMHVFRKATIREVSFCAVGADRGTSATVFSVGKPINQPKEVEMPVNIQPAEPPKAPGSLERDLAIQSLSDDKNSFAAKCGALEADKARLAGENAELRAQAKTLSFELENLNGSLARLREEAETLRKEKFELTKSSREALLAEDYKRLGLGFDAKSEAVMAVLAADESVFQAFRLTLGAIQKPQQPAQPPAGAFHSLTPQAPPESPAFSTVSLAELAAKRTRKEVN
jgi:hypothetical protein